MVHLAIFTTGEVRNTLIQGLVDLNSFFTYYERYIKNEILCFNKKIGVATLIGVILITLVFVGRIFSKKQITINTRASIKYSKVIPTKTPPSSLTILSSNLGMTHPDDEFSLEIKLTISDLSASEDKYQCFKNTEMSEQKAFLTGLQCKGKNIRLLQNVIPDEISGSYIKGFFMNYIYNNKVVKSEKLNFNESTTIKYGYDGDNKLSFNRVIFATSPNALIAPNITDFKKEFNSLKTSWKFKALKLSAKEIGIDFNLKGKIYIYDEDSINANPRCYVDTTNAYANKWEKSLEVFSQGGCAGKKVRIFQDMVPELTGQENSRKTTLYLNYIKEGKSIKQVKIPSMKDFRIPIDEVRISGGESNYDSLVFKTGSVPFESSEMK